MTSSNTRFVKPPVGAVITITMRKNDYYYKIEKRVNQTIRENVKVVPQLYPFDGFFIATGDPRFPVAAISMNNIIALEINGHIGDTESYNSGTKIVQVEGSKGNVYNVTIENGKGTSCECVGFQFRRQCRHLLKAVE